MQGRLLQIVSAGYFAANNVSDSVNIAATRQLPCLAGIYSSTTGASDCDTCPRGRYSSQGSTTCLEPQDGYIATDSDDKVHLSDKETICPAGKHSPLASDEKYRCLDCPEAHPLRWNQWRLFPAPAGMYVSGAEALYCDAGKYSSAEQLSVQHAKLASMLILQVRLIPAHGRMLAIIPQAPHQILHWCLALYKPRFRARGRYVEAAHIPTESGGEGCIGSAADRDIVVSSTMANTQQ